VWAITEIINNTTKITANHFAIVYETPETSPNPNAPATIATTKKSIAQINQPATAFLFIILKGG
jgi:hypothetical protein